MNNLYMFLLWFIMSVFHIAKNRCQWSSTVASVCTTCGAAKKEQLTCIIPQIYLEKCLHGIQMTLLSPSLIMFIVLFYIHLFMFETQLFCAIFQRTKQRETLIQAPLEISGSFHILHTQGHFFLLPFTTLLPTSFANVIEWPLKGIKSCVYLKSSSGILHRDLQSTEMILEWQKYFYLMKNSWFLFALYFHWSKKRLWAELLK